MNRRKKGSPARTALALLLWAGAVAWCPAAPITPGDAERASGFVTPPSSILGPESRAGNTRDFAAAATAPTNPRSLREVHDPILTPAIGSPDQTGRVAKMSPSAVIIEEDPRVDLGDVLRSVVQSTAAAVPWLHLVPPPSSVQRAGRVKADGAASADHLARLDEALASRGETSRVRSQGGAAPSGDAFPELTRELIELASELLANPLAWMVALLVAMVSVTVLVVRSHAK